MSDVSQPRCQRVQPGRWLRRVLHKQRCSSGQQRPTVVCAPRHQNAYWLGADVVVEIVSPDQPTRDTERKPIDYAEAGIPEYWIITPLADRITVLTLEGDAYREHGSFARGERARSVLLADYSVRVDDVLDAT